MSAELWVPVVGYEGSYEVSDLGNVRSVDRVTENPLPSGHIRRQFIKGRILKPRAANAGGYPYVNLSSGNKQQRTWHIHRLVMNAFVGPEPEGQQVRHLNGVPADCRLVNLAYGTPRENAADKVVHGTAGLKSECVRGHEYTAENTRVRTDRHGYVQRTCRACERARHHERKAS